MHVNFEKKKLGWYNVVWGKFIKLEITVIPKQSYLYKRMLEKCIGVVVLV